MFELHALAIPGAYSIEALVREDTRGTFVKTFHETQFSALGLATDYAEHFHSWSRAGVLRGMHFQAPPFDHDKLVFCVEGGVLDVILDLRAGSPTFRRAESVTLHRDGVNGVYIPHGCAHGFLSTTDTAILSYSVTSVHEPTADLGVRWNTIGLQWPVQDPIVSPRDAAFPSLAEFATPFTFEPRRALKKAS